MKRNHIKLTLLVTNWTSLDSISNLHVNIALCFEHTNSKVRANGTVGINDKSHHFQLCCFYANSMPHANSMSTIVLDESIFHNSTSSVQYMIVL